MRFENSCFNVPLFQKQVKRFSPLWGLYTFGLFLALPVMMFIMSQNMPKVELATTMHNVLMQYSAVSGMIIQASYGILVAMAVWSYLYNNRSVSMIHALPLTRGTLFCTNYITGLLFSIVPNVVMAGVGLLVQVAIGGLAVQPLFLALLTNTLYAVFFFSMATLIAFITGSLLSLPVFYTIFNFVTFALSMLFRTLFEIFVYGYSMRGETALSRVCKYLSPPIALGQEVKVFYPPMPEGLTQAMRENYQNLQELRGLHVLAIYAVVGLVLTFCAYQLYRRRPLETAGEVVAVGFLRPVFQYAVTFCLGLCGALAFYYMFDFASRQQNAFLPVFIFFAIWAVVGYYAATMLLEKSLRVFQKRRLVGAGAGVLAIAVFLLCTDMDIFRYEKYIPQAEEITNVDIWGWGDADLESPAEIEAALALHQSVLSHKSTSEQINWAYRNNEQGFTEAYGEGHMVGFSMEYFLENGKIVSRRYEIPAFVASLEDPESPARYYQTILELPEPRLRQQFPEQYATSENLVEVNIALSQKLSYDDFVRQYQAEDYMPEDLENRYLEHLMNPSLQQSFTGEDAKALYAAVRADIAAGALVQESLYNIADEDSKRYLSELEFAFRYPESKENKETTTIVTNRGDTYAVAETRDKDVGYRSRSLYLTLDAKETLRVLEGLGIVSGENLFTRQDVMDWVGKNLNEKQDILDEWGLD